MWGYRAMFPTLSCFSRLLSLQIQPFLKEEVLSFLQQTHNKKQQHNPHHISHCCCVCRTWCLITAVPPRHCRYNIGTAWWKSSIRYIKVAVSPRIGWKNPHWVICCGEERNTWSLLEQSTDIVLDPYMQCIRYGFVGMLSTGVAYTNVFSFSLPFLYPRKQKQKHQNSIFRLYSPQRAQWAQTPIQNSSKHSQCQSILLNFQPECSSIFMCLLYENSAIWMMEYKPLSHPSVVAGMVPWGHRGDERQCFWAGRRKVDVF